MARRSIPKDAVLPSLNEFAVSHGLDGTPEAMLRKYADEAFKKWNDGHSVLHRAAAMKQLLALLIFCTIAFLDISAMMLYHRNNALFVIILLAAVVALIFTFRRFNSASAMVRLMRAMPDADIENILAGEFDNMVSRIAVLIAKIALIAVTISALLMLFWEPHMIFENNDTGCGLRFYTNSFNNVSTVTVPDTYGGKPVTEIRGNVFQNLSSIRNIQLPGGITQIRAYTFENCTGLTAIDIPEGVTRIAAHAFYGCSSLREVTVPATVTEIGSSAFRECDRLYEISIPRGCRVHEKAFKNSPTTITRY